MVISFNLTQEIDDLVKAVELSHDIEILLISALTVDGVCACKILTELLQDANLTFKAISLSNAEDFLSVVKTHLSNPKDSYVFLLDCGGTLNLLKLLFNQGDIRRLVVIDSHRPFHLANIFSAKVILIEDVSQKENLAFLDILKNYTLKFSGIYSLDHFGSSKMHIAHGKNTLQQLQKSSGKLGRKSQGQEQDEEIGVESDEELPAVPQKKKAKATQNRQRKDSFDEVSDDGNDDEMILDDQDDLNDDNNVEDDEEEEEEPEFDEGGDEIFYRKSDGKQKVKEYERYISYSQKSCAAHLYEVSKSLGKKSNHHLWLSIVSFTELYLFDRIPSEQFVLEMEKLKAEVQQLNKSHRQMLIHDDYDDGLEFKNSNDDRIVQYTEYRLPLYRHWNLFDAFLHSPYTCSRMMLWNEKGRYQLRTLFAKLGIPLEQCKQNFRNMSLQYRQLLFHNLSIYARVFGLEDLLFPSFYRNYGLTMNISASDLVYCLIAIFTKVGCVSSGGMSCIDDPFMFLSTSNCIDDREVFLQAMATLDFSKDSMDFICNGITLAIDCQHQIYQQAIGIIERKSIINALEFRLVKLSTNGGNLTGGNNNYYEGGTSCGGGDIFDSPQGLFQLGWFLMEISKVRYHKSMKKLLICSENKEKTKTWVLGLSHEDRNEFGNAFWRTVKEMKVVQLHPSGMEANIFNMNADQVKYFIDVLHYILANSSSSSSSEGKQ